MTIIAILWPEYSGDPVGKRINLVKYGEGWYCFNYKVWSIGNISYYAEYWISEVIVIVINIPWICYERSFSELYLFIWSQLVLNQMLQLFVQSPQPSLLFFPWRTWMCFPMIFGKKKKKLIYEFRRTNPQELKYWSSFCVNYFLRYYLMMQHPPIVKRGNGTHEWAHRPYKLLRCIWFR